MFITDHQAFGQAQLTTFLAEVFGSIELGNGTSLAPAFEAVLAIDQQAAGATAADAIGLDSDELIDAAAALTTALEFGDAAFRMPFGSEVTAREPGGVKINGRVLALDAARPGLHPVETLRRDAHGPNLDLLQELIARRTRRLACRRLGVPTPKLIVNNEERTIVQFAPLVDAGNVSLQRRTWGAKAPRFCSATRRQISAFADSIVRDMRIFWNLRKEIGRRAELVRKAAEDGIVAEQGPNSAMRVSAIAIDLEGYREGDQMDLYVEFQGLDQALRQGTVLDFVPGWKEPSVELLRSAPFSDRLTRAELDALAEVGATGRIEEVASAIARAAPEGAEEVLGRLAADYDTLVVLPTAVGPLYATLFWQDGVIRAEAELAGRLDYARGRLNVTGSQLPETVSTTISGRLVSDIVKLPFACDCQITHHEPREMGFVLKIEQRTSLVNCEAGRIWPEPEGWSIRAAWKAVGPAHDEKASDAAAHEVDHTK